jgi:hypothetical protein
MKKIKQTCYFNPSVAFFIEDEATKNKTTFNFELNKYIERKLAEEEKESKILSELADSKETLQGILEILDALARK